MCKVEFRTFKAWHLQYCIMSKSQAVFFIKDVSRFEEKSQVDCSVKYILYYMFSHIR